MGVALIVRTSTSRRSCLKRSFCATPNRCSSSMTISPRSLKAMSFWMSRCVPMTTSTAPVRSPSVTWRCSTSVRKRLRTSTFTGKGLSRSAKVA